MRAWRRFMVALIVSVAALAAGGATPGPQPHQSDLELRFLDVGQGDAALVRHAGRAVLIDAGPSPAIVGRLRALGVDSLDLLIATHNHADHIGGAADVLRQVPVRFYLDNGHPHTTRTQERVLQAIEERGVTYLQAVPRTFELGDASLRVIPSPLSSADQNNLSLTLLLQRGRFTALVAGDAQVELLNALLSADLVPDVDVLKAPHHGSRNGVTPAWLARTKPEVVVISVGADNRYGHPHPWALRYYRAGGRQVFRTDVDGDIVVAVAADGSYQVSTEHAHVADTLSAPVRLPRATHPPPGCTDDLHRSGEEACAHLDRAERATRPKMRGSLPHG